MAIYISDNLIIDQDGSVYQATVKQENAYYRTYTYNYWGCIHPNFAVGSISFSYESWDKYNEVTETSAHFGVKVYGSVNSATAVGCELYNANKTKIGSCEDGAYRVNDYLIHHYSFASGSADINIQLTPVTGYYYRYYVVANGSKYYSEYYYFKTKGNTYTIAYNANTSASVSNMPGNQTKKQTVSLTLSSNKPTRTGYTFQGWATSASATSAEYQPGGSYTKDQNVTLYAVWKPNTYTVTYDARSGSVSPASKSVTYDSTYGTLATSTRTGYTFAGWFTAASGGSQITSSTKVTTAGNHTLYARWTPNTYTVSYNANGGSVSPTSNTVTYGGTLGTLPTPTRTGYTFDGWFTKISGGTQCTSSTILTAASNITIYAHWTANPYTVAYDANGGTGAPSSQTKYHDTALTLSSTKPTRTGYTFQGWATSATATSAEYQPGGSYKQNKVVTLYAVWKINTYTLFVKVWHCDDKEIIENNDAIMFSVFINGKKVAADVFDYCEQIAINSTYEIKDIKAQTGYQYNAPSKYSAPLSGQMDQDQTIIFDIYYSRYAVSYNANTTDTVSNMPGDQTKIHGTDLTLSKNKPTRTGYTFMRWSLRPDAYSGKFYPGDVYSADENVVLYAMWEKNGTEMSAGAGRSLLDGDYFICSALDESYILDINGMEAPAPENCNVQLYKTGQYVYNAWTLTYLDNGFYAIKQYDTQMALTVAGDSTEWRANIQVNTYKGSAGQQWSIERTNFGYRLKARCSGFSVDITGGKDYVTNGTNIQQFKDNLGDKAGNQSWVFVPYQPAQGLVPDFILPSALKTIEAEAFAGGAFQYAYLPEGTASIGGKAFADCPNLIYIYIPESCTSISKDAFSGVTGLTIFGQDGSYAEFYAGKNGFTFVAK